MNVYRVYPYKMGSRSARALAEALGCRRVRETGTYRPVRGHCIINWGNPRIARWMLPGMGGETIRVLNEPSKIANANNKLAALTLMRDAGVQVPEFTTDPDTIQLENRPTREVAWLARTLLRGSGGAGIELIYHGEEYGAEGATFPAAPLYVRYIKKTAEYRVHVFDGRVIDVQQKRKRREDEEVNYQIRNHSSGWIFCRENVQPPEDALVQATQAVSALGLHFGAADVVWNRHHGAFVLEVNTAPGLEGTTLNRYAEAFAQEN